MTARFGRNKKRAALKAVADAQAERDRAKESARYAHAEMSHSRRVVESMIERIIMAVGDDSALLPLGFERLRNLPVTATKHPIRRRIDPLYTPGPNLPLGMLSFDDVAVELSRLVMVVEDRPHDFAKLIRFRNENERVGGPRVFTERAIMVSEKTLIEIGLREDDLFYLVNDLVQQLARIEGRR